MKKTILLVEDNAVTRKLVRFTLENKGYAVLEASTGKLALELLDRQRPDLVLQDLVLPDIDGFELAAQIRAHLETPRVPLLAFTGFVSRLDEARLSAVGFDDLLVKPMEPSRLVKVIQSYLPDSSPGVASFGAGRRIIVADDDAIQLKLAAYRLGLLGFEVVTAADGREALDHAAATSPAAIVSDIMMPRLDGFQLCMEARQDASLRTLPVILMTSSYVDDTDRDLARRAGADAFVLRTPDLREVIDALRSALEHPVTVGALPARAHPRGLHADHVQRVIRQLERQLALNTGMAQRCALLASELAILSGISNALSSGSNLDTALDEVLAAFFDAAGVSTGALFIFDGDRASARAFGLATRWERREFEGFFGELDELRSLLAPGAPLSLPLEEGRLERTHEALARVGARAALVLPVSHRQRCLGALLISSNGTPITSEDRVTFGVGVASQIAQGIALSRAFDEKAVAERKAVERAALRDAMMASMSDGVAVSDEVGNFLFWNSAADSIMRLGPTNGGPERWIQHYGLFGPDKTTPVPLDDVPLVRALRGESVDRQELFVRHAEAPEGVWLSVNARPLVVGTQRRGAVAVFRDVTAEKATAERLAVSDRMASVGTLAAGVAHEINNPLASIIANVHLAVQDVAHFEKSAGTSAELEQLRDELRDAAESADRIRNIVRDLRVFSRSEEDTTGPVDVHRVMESTLRMAWNEIRHRARLVRNYGKVWPVEASESRLGQVFLNIVVNAAQAIPEGYSESNEIRISTDTREDGHVVIEITDTGPGIPPEVLGRLFTPFFTTKPRGMGIGLGLSISHQIVTMFGGSIEVQSEVGKGTTFRVALPPARSEEATRAPAVARVEGARRRGKVLVVDDEPMIVKAVKRTLSAEHDVVTVESAEHALALLRAGERFDVIFCDLMMPQITGMELHAQLVRADQDLADKMIFLTGGAFTAAAKAFLAAVPNLRIDKPFDLLQLRALVNDRVR